MKKLGNYALRTLLVLFWVPRLLENPTDVLRPLSAIIAASIGLVIVHEIGHLWGGAAVGSRLLGVTIGTGRQLVRLRFGSFLAVVRLNFMGGGSALVHTTHHRFYRTRQAIMLASGVGLELLVAYGVYRRFGFGVFATPIIALAVMHTLVNLNPWADHALPTDGRRILDLFTMTDDEILVHTESDYQAMRDIADSMERGDTSRLQAIADRALETDPNSLEAVRFGALAALKSCRFDVAAEHFARAVAMADEQRLPAHARGLLDNNAAYAFAIVGADELLAQARPLADRAVGSVDEMMAHSTRAAVMVQTGEQKAAIPILGRTLKLQLDNSDRLLTHYFLCLGYLAEHNLYQARASYANAFRLIDGPELERQVARLLPRLGAAEAVFLLKQRDAGALSAADQLGKLSNAVAISLKAWMASNLPEQYRWSLFQAQGGNAAAITQPDIDFLAGFVQSPKRELNS